MDGKFIAYYRVSTARQGRSGLGLDAQRSAVRDFLNGGNWTLLAEHTEIESGKRGDRIELARALKACHLTGATLLIAKLDRLSRDAHFLLGLEKAGVDFMAVDMPQANKLTVHIMAMVAQQEREAISARTKAALAQASKRRAEEGKPSLGGWRGGPKVDSTAGRAAQQRRADAFAGDLADILRPMRENGLSLRQMAAELTAKGIRTQRGGAWTPTGISNILGRMSAA